MKSRMILVSIFLLLTSFASFSNAGTRQLPYGSYLQSCINCRSSGYSLSCWCRTGSRTMPTYSKLHYADQCRFVENVGGRLHCARGDIRPLPQGSYADECRHCSYDGDNLSCSCMSRIGKFVRQYELPHANQCQRDIAFTRDGLKCLGQMAEKQVAVPVKAEQVSDSKVKENQPRVAEVRDATPVLTEETPLKKPLPMKTVSSEIQKAEVKPAQIIAPVTTTKTHTGTEILAAAHSVTNKWLTSTAPSFEPSKPVTAQVTAKPAATAAVIPPAAKHQAMSDWITSMLLSAEKEIDANQKTLATTAAKPESKPLPLRRSLVVDPPAVKPMINHSQKNIGKKEGIKSPAVHAVGVVHSFV